MFPNEELFNTIRGLGFSMMRHGLIDFYTKDSPYKWIENVNLEKNLFTFFLEGKSLLLEKQILKSSKFVSSRASIIDSDTDSIPP